MVRPLTPALYRIQRQYLNVCLNVGMEVCHTLGRLCLTAFFVP